MLLKDWAEVRILHAGAHLNGRRVTINPNLIEMLKRHERSVGIRYIAERVATADGMDHLAFVNESLQLGQICRLAEILRSEHDIARPIRAGQSGW